MVPGPRNLPGGYDTWQSHHLLCISAMGDRNGRRHMENSLHITVWNINKATNMIGLPQWRRYKQCTPSPTAAQNLFAPPRTAAAVPKDLPAHDVDHNTDDGYTDEVMTYLKKEIWNKFVSKAKDHLKDAEWLKDNLNLATTEFQDRLLARGKRSGTKGIKGTFRSLAESQQQSQQEEVDRALLHGGKTDAAVPWRIRNRPHRHLRPNLG